MTNWSRSIRAPQRTLLRQNEEQAAVGRPISIWAMSSQPLQMHTGVAHSTYTMSHLTLTVLLTSSHRSQVRTPSSVASRLSIHTLGAAVAQGSKVVPTVPTLTMKGKKMKMLREKIISSSYSTRKNCYHREKGLIRSNSSRKLAFSTVLAETTTQMTTTTCGNRLCLSMKLSTKKS